MFTHKWLTKVGPYKVEHVPFEDAGPLLASALVTRRGVQHTTEGSTVEGALSAYAAKRCAPTFTLGRDAKGKARILQHLPLGNAARALMNESGGVETNRVTIAQIELVAVSPVGKKWLPDPLVTDMLATLYHALRRECGIPLTRAVNPQRLEKVWNQTSGWYGHVDVPENDHVDPRGLDYVRLFEIAKSKSLVPSKVRAKPRKLGPVLLKRRAKKAPPAPLCNRPV